MAHVISSLRAAEDRLLAYTQAQPAAAKARPQAAATPTAASFRGLFSGKSAGATLHARPDVAPASPSPAVTNIRAVFSGRIAAATVPVKQPAAAVAPNPAQNSAPTAESVFGPNPWITNPTGVGPNGIFSYNPLNFATAATAAQVARMMGGNVVESNQLASAGGFAQQQPNQMVQLSNGALINAGLVASFYTHGYPQSYIDQLIASAVNTAT